MIPCIYKNCPHFVDCEADYFVNACEDYKESSKSSNFYSEEDDQDFISENWGGCDWNDF